MRKEPRMLRETMCHVTLPVLPGSKPGTAACQLHTDMLGLLDKAVECPQTFIVVSEWRKIKWKPQNVTKKINRDSHHRGSVALEPQDISQRRTSEGRGEIKFLNQAYILSSPKAFPHEKRLPPRREHEGDHHMPRERQFPR